MVDSIKICIPQHIKTNSTNIKTWISDLSYASTAVNSVKQATTTTAYANAVKNLSLRQAELALSTKVLTAEQQREILVTAGLIKETGTLTMAQATEALTTDTRNAADVEALMLKAGLVTELGAETTATITVDAAKLKELVDTKVLTQAEAELLAMKAGVTLQSTKEAATLIASNAKLGSSFAIMGKTAGAALKGIGKGLLSFASAHPILAIGATIIGSVAFFNSELKKLEEEQEELISNAKALQEEYRNFTKDTSSKINSLTSQADEFNELSRGVDKYGNNISLASDEYDRYKSIVAEILGYSPELIQGYDAEGNAIADKNGLLERSIELLKEEQRLKLKEMTTDEKTGEAYDAAEAGWQQVQGYEGANIRNEIARWFDNNAMSNGWNYEVDIAEILGIRDEWGNEGYHLDTAIIHNIETVVKNIKDKKDELLALEDGKGVALFTTDEIDNMIDLSNDWQYAYNQWQQDIEDAKHGMDDQFDLYAQRAKSYNDLTDAQKVFVNEYIRATGDITDAEGHLLSEDKILEKAKGYEKFVNEFAELNKLGEGGSVDLTFRPEIDTEELNKKGWEAGEGFATVFSSAISNTDFDDLIPENAEDTVAINFTPIIVDPNTGEFKGVLSEEELYAYAHDVLSGVREDDLNLQIGAKFEGKNAIDEAVADGERIHYLHEKLFVNNDTVDSWEELRKVLVKTGDDAVQAGENVNKMTVSLDQLKTASEGISSISSAFKQLSDDGYMSTESMSKIQEATKLSGDEWLEYQNKLMNAKAGSAEFNQVMSDLTFRIIDNTFNLEELKNATDEECDAVERQIAAILRENGVTNANAVAHDYVRMARVDAAIAAYDGTQASYDSAAALIKESLSAEQTKRALAQLEIAKILVNNVKINTQSDIENIIALANAAGASAGALLRLQRAKTIIANGFNAKTPGNSGYVSVADMREMDNIQTQLSNNTFDFGFKPLNSSDFTVASYGSNPSSGGGSGGGGSGSDSNEALDNYLKYVKHKKALGYYDDNTAQYINDLQYALNNLTKTEEEQWDLEEQIYSERENLREEEVSGYESWMSHLESLGYYEDDIAKKINDITWAIENQKLTEEEKFKKEEEIYKLTLDRNEKIRESFENLAKAHSETYNYALSDVKRYIEQLEHQKALTDDEALIKSIDRAIIDSMADGITKAEEAINNLTIDADYWKSEIEKKLKELGASFDISKWFDYEGNITSQFESDMDVLNNSEAENVISSWANIVSEKLKSVADNTNQIFEYQEKIFSDSKEAIEESISDIKEAAEEIFELRTSKLNSQSTLLKAQHSLINSIAETQHQLDKDILEAETAGARMSEIERESLFTRDEYNKLSGKLNDVLSEANSIQDEFNRKLKGATLDTIDEITNHYERQYELKMKEYEIVKAELDVAKAQQKLENVENEKSVRQWDGEKWIYTSVLQDVIDAQNELADAKYALAQAEIEQSQTEAIQEIDSKVDSLETQKNLFIAALEELTEGTSSAREKLNTALNEIADTDISLFRNIIDRVGETLSGLGAVISSVSMGEPVSSSGAVKVVSGTGNGGIHPVDANKASLKNTYAKGSRYTSRGIGLFDEDGLGSEIIVTKDGVLRQFNAGETVFNSDMVQRLWDYASSNPIPWNYPNTNLSNISSLINKSQTTQPVYDNRTYFNGVEVNDADGIRIMKEFATYLKSKV